MLKKHLIIVGGGWAGVSLAQSLKKVPKDKLRITLISDNPNFRYSPALYRVATGHKEHQALIPLHELLNDNPQLKIIKSSLKSIDPVNRTIKTHNGDVFHYDYAVLAIGGVTQYFNIPGLKELSYGIKTQKELRHFRTHLHQELIEEHKPDSNYIIVGAGPTGVELAAAMASYLKVIMRRHGIKHKRVHIELIEAAHRVLPSSNPKASAKAKLQLKKLGVKLLLNAKVEAETDTTLVVNGRSLPTHTVIWTAGIANNPFFEQHKSIFKLNNRGKVLVNDHLQTHPRLYVIGDNAVTPYSGLAITAVHNADYVARDILRQVNGHKKTPAYRPVTPASVIPIGKNYAIMQYNALVISGRLASFFRRFADYVAYKDIAGHKKALKLWNHTEDLEESCAVCDTRLRLENPSLTGTREPY
jgi:NADH:ubiquinone reductase (H+-translocating)